MQIQGFHCTGTLFFKAPDDHALTGVYAGYRSVARDRNQALANVDPLSDTAGTYMNTTN